MVAVLQQRRLPGLVVWLGGTRHGRFHDDELGPPVLQVDAPDDLRLVGLDVDRQEVGRVDVVLLDEPADRAYEDLRLGHLEPALPVALGDLGRDGRGAVDAVVVDLVERQLAVDLVERQLAVDLVERQLAVELRGRQVQVRVLGPLVAKELERGETRLEVDSAQPRS